MPNPIVPKPLLGVATTSLVLTGLADDGTGLLTPDLSVTLLTAIPNPQNTARNINDKLTIQLKEINSMNSPQENMVHISFGWTLHLEIFQINNGSLQNPLKDLLNQGYVYFLCQWVTGTQSGSIVTHTMYGTSAELGSDSQDRAEYMATLDLAPCDVGYPTIPQYSFETS
jgi:hypothetical protein